MPVLIEKFIVAGDDEEAKRGAELWRFLGKAFQGLHDLNSPSEILTRARREVPLDDVIAEWTVGNDPRKHADSVQELFDSGATIVNVHAGQQDQRKAIEFYRSQVLPRLQL